MFPLRPRVNHEQPSLIWDQTSFSTPTFCYHYGMTERRFLELLSEKLGHRSSATTNLLETLDVLLSLDRDLSQEVLQRLLELATRGPAIVAPFPSPLDGPEEQIVSREIGGAEDTKGYVCKSCAEQSANAHDDDPWADYEIRSLEQQIYSLRTRMMSGDYDDDDNYDLAVLESRRAGILMYR